MTPLTRRRFIGAAAGLAVAGPGLALPASGLTINPRSSWGSNHLPKGPLVPEDVKFLIVHHSASRNGHTGADVPGILRSWFNYHTGPEKGWNDIAYNFVVDSEGGIWEARQGSLDGPVAGDATGGNQGFTQLVCVIGDYNTAQPTQASLVSLVEVLAWLANRYAVSTSPGAEVTFTSRGSNKWPEGTEVTTPTITGHRTMSKTTCPGDNLNGYVVGGLTADVEAVRVGGSPPTTTSPPPASSTTTTLPPATTSTTAATTTTTTVPTTVTTVTPTVPSTSTIPVAAPTSTTPRSASGGGSLLLVGATSLLALGTALLLWRHRRMGGR